MAKDNGKSIHYTPRTQTNTGKCMASLDLSTMIFYRRNKINPRQMDAETRMRDLDEADHPLCHRAARSEIGRYSGRLMEHFGGRRNNDVV